VLLFKNLQEKSFLQEEPAHPPPAGSEPAVRDGPEAHPPLFRPPLGTSFHRRSFDFVALRPCTKASQNPEFAIAHGALRLISFSRII
jgi:hypothetical protein